MDKEDLQEAKTTATITKKVGVFDTTPLASKVLEPFVLQSKWDKLIADISEVKVNQKEINRKLDVVLELDKTISMVLRILSNEQ